MLQDDFVPVAIDQWYQRRQQDAEGEFWRKIASQGPRNDFKQTTQGHYICNANGELLGFNGNHMDLSRIRNFMTRALEKFDPDSSSAADAIDPGVPDPEFNFRPPAEGLVIRVHSKILGGYDEPDNKRDAAFQSSVGQDFLWIRKDEKRKLIETVEGNGEFPDSIAQRIARFHLIDNTRGEPPRWRFDQIKSLKLQIKDGVVSGKVKLITDDAKRGYEANLFGHIEIKGDEVIRFDLAAEGEFWGEGRYTGWAPEGKFPLAITFRLVDGTKPENQAVPHGGKGWIDGYYEVK